MTIRIFLIMSALLFGASLNHFAYAQETHEHSDHGDQAKTATYTCPMHPDVKSDSPGKCPICGMDLQKVKTKSIPKLKEGEKSKKKVKFYRHPMNPDITSKVPAKDDMGMDYIPVYEEEGNAGSLSDVPLRGVVHVDEIRLKLSGATLTKVQREDLVLRIPVSGRALSASRISVQVPESDISFLKPGLEVEASSPSVKDEILQGRIASMDSSLDPMTRTLRVDVVLTKSYAALRGESSVQGVVKKIISKALSVPESAIMYGQSGAYVFVADTEKALLIPKAVKVGAKTQAKVEVLEGLAENDVISAGPNFLVDSESRIQASHGP